MDGRQARRRSQTYRFDGLEFRWFQNAVHHVHRQTRLIRCSGTLLARAQTEWENYNSWYSGRTIGKVGRSKTRFASLFPTAINGRFEKAFDVGMACKTRTSYTKTMVNVYRALLEMAKPIYSFDPDGEITALWRGKASVRHEVRDFLCSIWGAIR